MNGTMDDEQRLLHSNPMRPVPLNHNFYEQILQKNLGSAFDETASTAESSEHSYPSTSATAPDTANIVEHLMKTNERYIAEAALKQVANSVVNVNHQQFNDLIPISFDQDEFIKNIEAQMAAKKR
ncbi:unnamed protein product [Caenorhabditis bovis]|uniref:Uncharacterized protein n=1 Tax=Caenorhabditis bovis TaxID=2654633 RepID=A0A8S1ELG3_9PELO|nr:unnamed protein product [Caenorhabditis bovis]